MKVNSEVCGTPFVTMNMENKNSGKSREKECTNK